MENSSIIKQAKSDIFKELHPIISFYIKKGAKANALKKYYKNNKRFNDVLEDIRNKGINLVKDETEYKKIVRQALNDILDDFIAKEKDDLYNQKQKSKLKYIKEFNSYNESVVDWFLGIGTAYFTYKFLKGIIKDLLWKHKLTTSTPEERNKIRNNNIALLNTYNFQYLLKKLEDSFEYDEVKYQEDFGTIKVILGDLLITIDKLRKTIEWRDTSTKDILYKTLRPINITEQEIKELKDALEKDKENEDK